MIIRSACHPATKVCFARCVSTSRDPKAFTSNKHKQHILRSGPSSKSRSQDGPAQSNDAPPPPSPPSVSSALAEMDPAENRLLAPVHIPEDPLAVLKYRHPAAHILAHSGLVVQRQIEMMNLFLGFEQANRYVIMDPQGNHVGYMAEHDGGFGKVMGRQWFKTHRAFTTHVFDRHSKEVLRFYRPFSWINSRIRVYDPLEPDSFRSGPYTSPSTSITTALPSDPNAMRQISHLPLSAMRIIGEAHSEWAPLRRKYTLFLAHDPSTPDAPAFPSSSPTNPSALSSTQQNQLRSQNPENPLNQAFTQFAYINEPFLSWDFSLLSASNQLIGSVNRNFAGFAREIFTDTGVYALRMDAAGLETEAAKNHIISKTGRGETAYADVVGGTGDRMGMTLDQRAVMLATAVTVDFDYFSRHSGAGGMGMMPFMMGGGGEAAGGAAAGGAAGGAAEGAIGGAVVGGAGRAVGGAAVGEGAGVAAGVGEGAIAGAGTMAGYEAMQRGMGRRAEGEGAPLGEAAPDDASPQAGDYGNQDGDQQSPQQFGGEGDGPGGDVWGSGGDNDPWSQASGGGGGDGGEGGGGGIFQWIWDMFFGGGD